MRFVGERDQILRDRVDQALRIHAKSRSTKLSGESRSIDRRDRIGSAP
jgi:hypothetical protein